jgi:histidinol dehydrogenase
MKCRRIIARQEAHVQICEELGMRGKMDLGPVTDTVNDIIMNVKKNRDEAVRAYTLQFDRVDLAPTSFRVTPAEMENAMKEVAPELLQVLRNAASNIRAFHEKQKETGFSMDVAKGASIGMLIRPLSIAGIYIPGGTAPLPSTVLMNVIPAKTAGVPRVVLCTPPRADGTVAPVILAAAQIAGADEIYKVGGAQAIAAMACGTPTIPRVDKICGPGNIYVNTAKRLVFGQVDIDMFAGPSEIVIIADDSANPEFVAADMLSQAEHDMIASAILLSTSEAMSDAVAEAIDRRSECLDRREILERSLADYCAILTVPDLDAAITFANELAPEHLELCIQDAGSYVDQIQNAGAIFLGNYTPEPLGDYYAGPNHTLPTSGTARFFSPLNTGDFVKKMSVLQYNKESLRDCYRDVALFAEAEGLDGHAAAVRVRFEKEYES